MIVDHQLGEEIVGEPLFAYSYAKLHGIILIYDTLQAVIYKTNDTPFHALREACRIADRPVVMRTLPRSAFEACLLETYGATGTTEG